MQEATGLQPATPPASLDRAPALPQIASFWQRLGAAIIDSLILGVIGQIVALVFNGILFQIGPYGRPIGLLLILPYFGILNSRLGGGQTLGKRALRIAVRNGANEPISPARSLARIAVLVTPELFNGWAIPAFTNPVLAWIAAVAVFGLGGAILYSMLFNRRARQGLHDWVVATYVVRLRGDPIAAFPRTARIHHWVAGGWVALVSAALLVVSLLLPASLGSGNLATLNDIYSELNDDGRFFSSSVMENVTFISGGGSSRSLVITAWYRGNPGSEDRAAIADDIVRLAFDRAPTIDTYDAIRVSVTSAYDIGVASGNFSLTFAKSVDDWRLELGLPRP